ncbi:methylated-DNA-protein-cysteine methyltransferase related protein, partial [Phenoliferia sp. Uapishka_3]
MAPIRTRKRSKPSKDATGAHELPLSPTFNADVYAYVRRIPEGKVVSYGDIAKALGRPRNARLVGSALKCLPSHLSSPYLAPPSTTSTSASESNESNEEILAPPQPNPDFVPFHRVLSGTGVISPRAGGIRPLIRQADYLRAEGVEVSEGPRAGGANAGPPAGVDAFGLGGIHGGRVSMAHYRWDGL